MSYSQKLHVVYIKWHQMLLHLLLEQRIRNQTNGIINMNCDNIYTAQE